MDSNNTGQIFKAARSLPIPKEVNNYVLKHYGHVYYNCQDCGKKNQILKEIVEQLSQSGYIVSMENIERRLKNMKSHYRRKKSDLDLGLITSIDWEYYQALDQIFAASEGELDLNSRAGHPVKRSVEPKVENNMMEREDVKPQDLSIKKRPKLIKFDKFSEIKSQFPPEPEVEVQPSSNSSNLVLLKIIESIKDINKHRLVLDQQRVAMEIRRYELDILSTQLTDLLFKLTHPDPETQSATN